MDEDALEDIQAFKDQSQKERLIKYKRVAPKFEWFFKRCMIYILGESFLKEFRRSKKPKKKDKTT